MKLEDTSISEMNVIEWPFVISGTWQKGGNARFFFALYKFCSEFDFHQTKSKMDFKISVYFSGIFTSGRCSTICYFLLKRVIGKSSSDILNAASNFSKFVYIENYDQMHQFILS